MISTPRTSRREDCANLSSLFVLFLLLLCLGFPNRSPLSLLLFLQIDDAETSVSRAQQIAREKRPTNLLISFCLLGGRLGILMQRSGDQPIPKHDDMSRTDSRELSPSSALTL
jgi:hypothetical protein